jgi:hypothetical protein
VAAAYRGAEAAGEITMRIQILLGTIVAGAAFLAGRASVGEKVGHDRSQVTGGASREVTDDSARGATSSARLTQQAGETPGGTVPAPAARSPATIPPTAPAAAAGAAAEQCPAELVALRARLATEEHRRVEVEGTPIPEPQQVKERFTQASLTSAVTAAFRESGVPGRLETTDCQEYPCIVYGRILGDERHMERLERSQALAAYEGDILTLLYWAATDEAVRERTRPGDDRPERALFALALYPRGSRSAFGDNLDKRIRSRTADLWNGLRPDDQE